MCLLNEYILHSCHLFVLFELYIFVAAVCSYVDCFEICLLCRRRISLWPAVRFFAPEIILKCQPPGADSWRRDVSRPVSQKHSRIIQMINKRFTHRSA